DFKKAKKMIPKHELSLSKPQKTLFGKGFYKALRKSTKIKKSSRDISNHFGGSRKKSSRPPQTRATGGDYRRTQPFRKEPSFQTGRGGGRQVSFRGSAKAPYTNFKGYSKALQNGGSPPFEADYNQGRPYDQNRSKGRLFLCANERESSTISEVSMGGDAVPIHLSTFRACPSTPPVYKIVETGCGTLTEDRLKDDYLPGRHNNLQPVQGRDNEGQGLNPMVTPSSRVCCQLEKIHTGPQLPDGVLGVCYRQQGDEIIPPSDKNQSFGPGLHRVSTQQRMFGQNPCTNVRQIDLNRTGDPSSPLTLPSLADATVIEIIYI
ncbi:hypothetical protein AC249_AIPGENE8089, partial [Exaiptasia diaphana]